MAATSSEPAVQEIEAPQPIPSETGSSAKMSDPLEAHEDDLDMYFPRFVAAMRIAMLSVLEDSDQVDPTIIAFVAFQKAMHYQNEKESWGRLGTEIIIRVKKYWNESCQATADDLFRLIEELKVDKSNEALKRQFRLTTDTFSKLLWKHIFGIPDSVLLPPLRHLDADWSMASLDEKLSKLPTPSSLPTSASPIENPNPSQSQIGGPLDTVGGWFLKGRDKYRQFKGDVRKRVYGPDAEETTNAKRILPSMNIHGIRTRTAGTWGRGPSFMWDTATGYVDADSIVIPETSRYQPLAPRKAPYPHTVIKFTIDESADPNILENRTNDKQNNVPAVPFFFFKPEARSKGSNPSGIGFIMSTWWNKDDFLFKVNNIRDGKPVNKTVKVFGEINAILRINELRDISPSKLYDSIVADLQQLQILTIGGGNKYPLRVNSTIRFSSTVSRVGQIKRTDNSFQQAFNRGNILIFRNNFSFMSATKRRARFWVDYIFEAIAGPIKGEVDYVCREIRFMFPLKHADFPVLSGI